MISFEAEEEEEEEEEEEKKIMLPSFVLFLFILVLTYRVSE